MEDDKITPGDIVKIRFEYMPDIVGEVLYVAGDTGDCWHIRENENGLLVYVQNFSYMIRYPES